MSQGGQLANEIVLACDQIACSLYPTSFGICGFDITMFSSPLQAQIRKHCAISASVGGAALVCGALQQGCFAIMGQKLARRLRITLMSAILSQVGCHVPQTLAHQLGVHFMSAIPSQGGCRVQQADLRSWRSVCTSLMSVTSSWRAVRCSRGEVSPQGQPCYLRWAARARAVVCSNLGTSTASGLQ